MNAPPGTADPSFHEGECAVQERVGVREKLAVLGPRVIRDFMPEQHREFFSQLPFVIVGSVDDHGQPWATVLANPPGFVESPSPQQLLIRAQPQAFCPLGESLLPGNPIALLGIEPHTRRRNRVNGVLGSVAPDSFAVHVRQSFGNCPKYIQARKPEFQGSRGVSETELLRSDRLGDAAATLIRRADTFFVATAYPADERNSQGRHGVDVSHRGGKPGFVRVDGDALLTVPDFTGNYFFNTLGNISVNPRAGLLFMDFMTGNLLYLAVDAEVIWEGTELEMFTGAERLLRFRVREMKLVKAALPLRWGESSLSPFLAGTGSWSNEKPS